MWSSKSSTSSTVACNWVFFAGTFPDARFGAVFDVLAAFLEGVAVFLSLAVTSLLTDFCFFRGSSGSPFVLALLDCFRLRGPDTSREVEIAVDLGAMKFRNGWCGLSLECGLSYGLA